ncbi:DoxX family protein [Streptomyces gardneri]|uniref:DoxX family protein n=1 Tax=Streptomyces gardneri TaxID=66892 RepID=UPI0006BD785D|nr:DoxX family protein [Streptomyces gardneri]QPK43920.1 DoxX family protein [Streptomyces gardneri]WRK35185.1 DoxX family protein [Streptomyces venezuelae]CUM43246.1 putative integral membrane protein [Streptomyces venezuelae]
MFAVYVVLTVLTAAVLAYAACLDFVRHPSIAAIADRVSVPRTWMVPLGACLAAGSAGLLAGFVVPWIGVAAGLGLVLYFLGAVGAHLRVGDLRIGGALVCLALSVAVLVLGITRPTT